MIVFLIIYGTSGAIVDTLFTPSLGKCMELSAKMKMMEFSLVPGERFKYDCQPKKKTIRT